MKGSLASYFPRIIGYVINLAIFVVIMAIILYYWFNFQTIPQETPQQNTACDLGYYLTLWKNATSYPNILNKSFLERWNDKEIGANLIERGTSKFFLPGDDFFVSIRYVDEGGNNYTYKLYVPPESKSSFETCNRPILLPKAIKELKKNHIDDLIGNYFSVEDVELYKKYGNLAASSNLVSSLCYLPVFIDTGNMVEIGDMVILMSSNIATKIRQGIYELSKSDEPKDNVRFYYLGPYPIGCVVNKGMIKKEKAIEEVRAKAYYLVTHATSVSEFVIGVEIYIIAALQDLWNKITGAIGGAAGKIGIPEIVADCGFDWEINKIEGGNPNNYTDDTYVLSVYPITSYFVTATRSNACNLSTRIPRKILRNLNLINDSGDLKNICTPRLVSLKVWWPEKKHFFLKIIKMNNEPNNERAAIEFCESRCKTELPFYSSTCSDFCEKPYDIDFCKTTCENEFHLPEPLCSGLCVTTHLYPYIDKLEGRLMFYNLRLFTQKQVYMYKKIPKGAIDIQYVAVDEKKLNEKGSIKDIDPKDYDAYQSACATWPGIFDCIDSKNCGGDSICIDKGMDNGEYKIECDTCENNIGKSCSPKYLDYNLNLISSLGYYTCQKVGNYSTLLTNSNITACLPNVNVQYKVFDENGNEILDNGNPPSSISCSTYHNAKVEWIINASDICCESIDKKEGVDEPICGKIKTDKSSGAYICPRIKFWVNLNFSNSFYLNKDLYYIKGGYPYVGNITQQVCRDNVPLNNAKEAFLVASYYAGAKEIKYIYPFIALGSNPQVLDKLKLS